MPGAQTRKRPLIVPLFIPNQGCPHRCVYCHQEKITSQRDQSIDPPSIERTLRRALLSPGFDPNREPEVAFYGGTFTRLPEVRIKALLGAVTPFLREGWFRSIRLSTRPDSLRKGQLDLMGRLGVATVELGAQSMDDNVLALSRRGHTARDTVDSAQTLKGHGFKVGIQLMPGLPGDTRETFMKSVREVIRLQPHGVRIYPTLVIKGTELARWYQEKRYQPWSLEEAVEVCQEACIRLEEEGIPVIRMGLMSSPGLLQGDEILAGPWHGAFGFLVRSGIYQEKIASFLPRQGLAKRIRIRAAPHEIPLVGGHRNQGLRGIEERTGARVVGVVGDEAVPPGQIRVDIL